VERELRIVERAFAGSPTCAGLATTTTPLLGDGSLSSFHGRIPEPQRAHGVGNERDLVEEALVRTECRVLDGERGVDDDEACRSPVGLAAQHSPHPLDHRAPAPAGGESDDSGRSASHRSSRSVSGVRTRSAARTHS